MHTALRYNRVNGGREETDETAPTPRLARLRLIALGALLW